MQWKMQKRKTYINKLEKERKNKNESINWELVSVFWNIGICKAACPPPPFHQMKRPFPLGNNGMEWNGWDTTDWWGISWINIESFFILFHYIWSDTGLAEFQSFFFSHFIQPNNNAVALVRTHKNIRIIIITIIIIIVADVFLFIFVTLV